MKYFLLSLALLMGLSAFAQVQVAQGNNSPQFSLSKQVDFTSFTTAKADYFVLKRTEHFENINTLIVADKSGSIITDKEIRVNMGSFNNQSGVKNLLVVNSTPVVFVGNRDKNAGKNTLTASTIDDNGNISTAMVTIGSMDFEKMSNAGDWYAALTPDQKHVAVIGKSPYEKGTATQFSYFMLDDKLQVTGKGTFTFAGNDKNIYVTNFLASDKGDLYIIADDFDKSYKHPTLYKYSVGGTGVIVPVMTADPGLKNLNYIARLSPRGDLVLAGYMQKKSTFSAGDPAAIGTWMFNSSKSNEVKTFNFDKPITNATARNLVYNGDVWFLVGEQYKADKVETTVSGPAAANFEEIYNYTHGDIIVTGFSADGSSKKFDLSVERQWTAKDFDQDLTVASGTIGNKLAVVFNDQYGKYIDDRYHKNLKLPVAVLVSNAGVVDSPVIFANELDVKVSSYTLYPQFFNNDQGHLMVLSGNAQSIKTVTFQ
ncbi:hypothetical protein [Mucilaginibacter sp.]|uniref:hypothetical protein n=1 Tax=Mucilaginibacter sp. TaxID=1882438 RepID=UPI00283B8409|nr:hypothetical protein [Mucilaginibacter sp.]MDR3696145.1 hypothetical protein [Mucilaginibacter sp.]